MEALVQLGELGVGAGGAGDDGGKRRSAFDAEDDVGGEEAQLFVLVGLGGERARRVLFGDPVDGDKVWLRMAGSGTNDGSFMGNPPTGRRMRTDVFDVVRIRDGKIVEHWGVPDRLGTLFQLGLAQPPGARPQPPSTTQA